MITNRACRRRRLGTVGAIAARERAPPPAGAGRNRESCFQLPVDATLNYREHSLLAVILVIRSPQMSRTAAVSLVMLLSTAAQATEYMEKTPFQLSPCSAEGKAKKAQSK